MQGKNKVAVNSLFKISPRGEFQHENVELKLRYQANYRKVEEVLDTEIKD